MKLNKNTDGVGKYMKKLNAKSDLEAEQGEDRSMTEAFMPFTDADLKRLKEMVYVPIPAGQYLESTLDNEFLRNLIARLDAAEKVVSLAIQYTLIADEIVPIGDAVKAWKAVRGD